MKTRERLIDLVFDELGPEASRRALIEIEGCHDCLAQYRSMTETLRVFDLAAETSMPDENYWPGYETRLRERLPHERPNLKRRLVDWIGGFWPLTMRPLPLAVGLALVLLSIGWWSWRRGQAVDPSPIAYDIPKPAPTAQPKVESHDKEIVIAPKPGAISDRQKTVYPKLAKPGAKAPSVRREERDVAIVENDVVSRGSDQSLIAASLFTPETIRHFEKAQLMLRSFRAGSAAKGSAAPDLAYEKQLSQRLLYQNILLRRDAEMKGNLPAEEALSSLEPFLLDIANLPDKPSRDALGGIRERLQRKELIAALHISSAQSYQNP